MLKLEEMCMFDQLPSCVHWNLTQIQKTDVDIDLPQREIRIAKDTKMTFYPIQYGLF